MSSSKSTITTENITDQANQAITSNNVVPPDVEEALREAGLDVIEPQSPPDKPLRKGEYTEELDKIFG